MALYDDKFRPAPFGMTDEERNAKAAKVPGTAAVTAIARPSLGTQVGQAYRSATNAGIGATESAANAITAPTRYAGGFLRDATRGFTGAPNPDAGTPQGLKIELPRYGASAAPVTPPRPGATAAPAAIASPGVRFAGIDAAPDNFYRNPPGTKPRNAAELDQASKAETAARNQASLPGASAGAGASTTAGAGAPINKSVGKFGETVYSNVGSQYGTPATGGTIGTVNTQNFGNPVVPQAPGSIARPGVASTFGLGVNDPRLQAAPIARPGQLTLNPNGNAETFNARQDREASKALASDLGTEAFLLRGKTDPASLRALADVAQTRAGLLSGTEGLSAAAIQGTANRGNQYGIADLNNAGENNRAGIQADVARAGQQVTREGQQLNASTELAKIARPELRQDANGNFVNIAGNTGTPVVDAQGKPVRGQQTQADTGQITPALQLQAINKELASLAGNPPVGDDPAYAQRVQELRAQQSALLNGGGQPATTQGMLVENKQTGEKLRYNPATKQWEPVK